MAETNVLSSARRTNSPNRLPLPMELFLAALDQLDQYELAQKTKEFDKDKVKVAKSIRSRILEEAERQASKPIAEEAWGAYQRNVSRNVWERTTDKTLEDPIYSAILNRLAAKSNRQYINVREMMRIFSNPQVISQLKEVGLLYLRGTCIPLFQHIRRLNPDMKWTFGFNRDTFEDSTSLKALDGLNGTMYASVNNSEDLSILGNICKNAHRDFRLDLKIIVHGIKVSELEQYPPILERLASLRLKADNNYSEIPVFETMCQKYDFEVSLEGSDLQFLSSTTYIPQRLVSLVSMFPEEDKISQLATYGKKGVLRELHMHIRELRSIDHTQFQCPLTHLSITNNLRNREDILFFTEICDANPGLTFGISLEHKGLLRFFLDRFSSQVAIRVFEGQPTIFSDNSIAEGFKLHCDDRILENFPGLDLSSLTKLRLSLGNGHAADGRLITTILKVCPRLRKLAIEDGDEYEHLGDLPTILQQAVIENCPNLKKLRIFDQFGFADISLPGFVKETEIDALVWRRVRAE